MLTELHQFAKALYFRFFQTIHAKDEDGSGIFLEYAAAKAEEAFDEMFGSGQATESETEIIQLTFLPDPGFSPEMYPLVGYPAQPVNPFEYPVDEDDFNDYCTPAFVDEETEDDYDF